MREYSILFVCLGNICRSPAAEGIMRHMLGNSGKEGCLRVDSAGIGNWHVGQLPDSRMRRHGFAHGYNFDSRARQFTGRDFVDFDFIVTMDADNQTAILSKAKTEGDRAKVLRMADFLQCHSGWNTIPDPYYGSDKDFEMVIELLEDACGGLLRHVLSQSEATL